LNRIKTIHLMVIKCLCQILKYFSAFIKMDGDILTTCVYCPTTNVPCRSEYKATLFLHIGVVREKVRNLTNLVKHKKKLKLQLVIKLLF
jgi:hypothetical protein